MKQNRPCLVALWLLLRRPAYRPRLLRKMPLELFLVCDEWYANQAVGEQTMELLEHEQTKSVGEATDEESRNLMLGWKRWLMDQPEKPDSKIRCYLLTLTTFFGCVEVICPSRGKAGF